MYISIYDFQLFLNCFNNYSKNFEINIRCKDITLEKYY